MKEKPPAGRKSFKVSKGNRFITVYPWKHPKTGKWGWRFCWRKSEADAWQYVTRKSKDEIAGQAERILDESEEGIVFSSLPSDRRRWLEEVHRSVPPSDQARVLAFIRGLAKTSDLASAVGRFCEGKKSKAGEETPHLKTLRNTLEGMTEAFPKRSVLDVQFEDLRAWWEDRCATVGWKRKKDIRADLIQFWRWAMKEGIAGNDPVTIAERLPEIGGRHGDRQIMTMQELRKSEETFAQEYRAWLVLGCFAGLRPEEIAPAEGVKKLEKRGLLCEEIDWEFRCIRIAPEVSKVGFPRIIPFNDALVSGLEWAKIKPGMTGPVCLRNPSQTKELARVGKVVFGGAWPKDICRHSYGSNRNAELRDLAKVAEEMGTSVSMMNRHYHNPRSQAEGRAWFAHRFGVPMGSDETQERVAESQNFEILTLNKSQDFPQLRQIPQEGGSLTRIRT